MPAVTALSLAGIAPVTVSYTPMRRGTDETAFADRRRLLPTLYGSLKKSVKQLRNIDRTFTGDYRVNSVINDPVVRTVDGAEAVVNANIININCRFAGDATDQEKDHVIKLAVSYLQSTYFTTSAKTGESDYA